MKATAHEIAASPELYNLPVKIGKNIYECTGYSRSGLSVRFSRLVPVGNKKLRQVNVYVNPDKVLEVSK